MRAVIHAALSVVVVLGACEARHEPPMRGTVGSASGSGSGSGSGSAAPAPAPAVYRTATSTYHVKPELTANGKTFMVVSENADASAVGRDILAADGNAVDAAVATAFALAVVHPEAGNLGGGGFAVVRVDAKTEVAIDFREMAPAAATPDMFIDKDGKAVGSLAGDKAAGVPGSVAGLAALHKKYGKLPWPKLIAPAIAFATNGYIADPLLQASLTRVAPKLAANAAAAAIYLDHGAPIAAGTKIKNPDLAATLQLIADKGPDGFYTGPTADAIAAEMTTGGGLITAADLKAYKAEWRDPLKFDYRGYHIASMPPPSSGGVVIAMAMGMLHATDLGKLGWHSAEHVHWLVEIWRRAYAARNELLGDPAFVKDMPLTKLMSQPYEDQLVATIQPGKATPSKDVAALLEGTHTTNLSVVDGHGMAVALTTTLNTAWGNLVVVPHTGMLLNNEMDDFSVKPGSPNVFGLVQGTANRIEPGKRMLSSMSPSIVEDAHGDTFMVVGAQGGPRIITDVFQTISNVIDFHMTIDAAVAAPRIHHQHLPDTVFVENDSIDQPTTDALTAMGYKLDWADAHRFGGTTAIAKTATGWQGAADPHTGGGAVGDP